MIIMISSNNVDFLRKNAPFYEDLTPSQKSFLLENTDVTTRNKGEIIICDGSECIGVLLVKSGELRAFLLSEDGREITLFRVLEGEICVLSASCVLHHVTFDVQIEVETNSEVLRIRSGAFKKLLDENIKVENFALSSTVSRFSEVMWAMQQILFMSFDKRLATFLLKETDRLGTDNLIMTHEQIAKYMGSAREVVSRMLKYFEKENMVKLRRGGVEIVDFEGLREMTD